MLVVKEVNAPSPWFAKGRMWHDTSDVDAVCVY